MCVCRLGVCVQSAAQAAAVAGNRALALLRLGLSLATALAALNGGVNWRFFLGHAVRLAAWLGSPQRTFGLRRDVALADTTSVYMGLTQNSSVSGTQLLVAIKIMKTN